MTTQNNETNLQAQAPMPTQVKLAAAWTSFMFLYVYVDLLGFFRPGVVEDILAGVVWEFQITQTFLVIALGLMAVPIMMIALSTVLAPRASRMANLVVASLYVPLTIFNAVGESWTYYFWGAVGLELAVLALILHLAWTLPRATHLSRGWSRKAPAASLLLLALLTVGALAQDAMNSPQPPAPRLFVVTDLGVDDVEITHVEPAEDGMTRTTVYRPRVADIEVYDAGGTILGGDAFLAGIDVGTVVLVAADENPVDPIYLSILRDDAFILVGVVVRVETE